jgi:hypothetical protein
MMNLKPSWGLRPHVGYNMPLGPPFSWKSPLRCRTNSLWISLSAVPTLLHHDQIITFNISSNSHLSIAVIIITPKTIIFITPWKRAIHEKLMIAKMMDTGRFLWVILKEVQNLRVPSQTGNSLTRWTTVGFSRWALSFEGSVRDRTFINQLSDYQFFNKGFGPSSYLVL